MNKLKDYSHTSVCWLGRCQNRSQKITVQTLITTSSLEPMVSRAEAIHFWLKGANLKKQNILSSLIPLKLLQLGFGRQFKMVQVSKKSKAMFI